MNQEEIIEMAREAGLTKFVQNYDQSWAIEQFYKMAVERERKACEKECEEQFDLAMVANEKAKRIRDKDAYYNSAVGSRFCLLRIRARGEA